MSDSGGGLPTSISCLLLIDVLLPRSPFLSSRTWSLVRRSSLSLSPSYPVLYDCLATDENMAGGPLDGGNFVHDNTIAPKENKVLSLFSLKDKTAIVSGAGAGIGLAVAQGFAEAGANVAIWYNSNRTAVDRAAEIEKEYGVKCETDSSFPRLYPFFD